MKRLVLAAVLLAAGAAAPVSAQPYGYGPRHGGPGPYYDDPPPPPRRGPPPGYGGYGYDPGPYGPRPGRRGSSVCVTSRGNCPIGGYVPRNTPCGCEVPGFGYKRGAAG